MKKLCFIIPGILLIIFWTLILTNRTIPSLLMYLYIVSLIYMFFSMRKQNVVRITNVIFGLVLPIVVGVAFTFINPPATAYFCVIGLFVCSIISIILGGRIKQTKNK